VTHLAALALTGAEIDVDNNIVKLRAVRAELGLEWVTPHTTRKTVATILERESTVKTASAQLGHSSEQITQAAYIQRAAQAPTLRHPSTAG